MDEKQLTLKEARVKLVEIYLGLEKKAEEVKHEMEEVVSMLDPATEAQKIKALISLAKKEAKGKFQEFKNGVELSVELLEELEDGE